MFYALYWFGWSCSTVSTQTSPDDPFEAKVGTVGRVGPHLEIKVADPETGETLPLGEPGEFCTKGYAVMLGYWDNEEKTDEVLVDGWMHTGDIARDGRGGIRPDHRAHQGHGHPRR